MSSWTHSSDLNWMSEALQLAHKDTVRGVHLCTHSYRYHRPEDIRKCTHWIGHIMWYLPKNLKVSVTHLTEITDYTVKSNMAENHMSGLCILHLPVNGRILNPSKCMNQSNTENATSSCSLTKDCHRLFTQLHIKQSRWLFLVWLLYESVWGQVFALNIGSCSSSGSVIWHMYVHYCGTAQSNNNHY